MDDRIQETTGDRKRTGLAACFILLVLASGSPAVAGGFYVAQTTNVVEVDETGTQIDVFAANFWGPNDVAVDSAGIVYVSDGDGVKRYQPDGTYLGVFVSGLYSPGGIAIDDAGVLYVANNNVGDDEVHRYLPDGTPLPPIGAGVLNEPWGIAVDSAGRIYVVEDLGPIERFDAAGNYLGEFAVNPAQLARSIAIDSNDTVYVGSIGAARIDKFSPFGTHLGMFTNVVGSWGLAVDENDIVYATGRNAGTIEHFDPSGTHLGSFATGLHLPGGLCFQGAAASSGGRSDGLAIASVAGGDLLLTWNPSCRAGDTDYEVYEGTLGDFTSHVDRTCSTVGATSWTLTPSGGSSYYLVVPTDGAIEGSYGLDSGGAERSQGLAACMVQQAAACP